MIPSLASVPPMGWNSWNTFGHDINETVVRETADALVSSGLRDHGYEYIVIDDCWSVKERRDSSGDLIPDPEKFPNGMKALADYVHSKGFKFGIYSDAAEKTCANFPGSYGFEEQDAQLWASWEVDFLKYDYCHAPKEQAAAIERYARMGEALRNTGRQFLYSLCEWGGRAPHLWGRKVGGHMWRVSGDVHDTWENFRMNGSYGMGLDALMDIAHEVHEYGGPGGWNDLDMLIVGLKGKGQSKIAGTGLSFLEYQTQMSLWSVACSPLMIGCDVRQLDSDTASLLMNREVLDVNQDPLGIPARRVKQIGQCEIWTKRLADTSVAVSVINRGSRPEDVTVQARDIGMLDTPKLARNLWMQQDTADFRTELVQRVQAHETVLWKVTSS
jgi:alpha-galactosidase